MKLVFAYDHYFYPNDDGTVFSADGDFNYQFWQRYLAVFASVHVIARKAESKRIKDWSEANQAAGPGLSFTLLPSLLESPASYIKERDTVYRSLQKALYEADALIARLPSEIGAVSVQVAERMGKPWAIEVVGCPRDCIWYHGRWEGKLFAPYSWWRTRRLLRRAPFALYVSSSFLQRRYPCPGKTVSCSNVNIKLMENQRFLKKLERFNNLTFPVNIGFIGNLTVKYKGLDVALRALSLARPCLPPFRFHILGGGDASPWKAMAEQLGLADQTFFCGTKPRGDSVLEWLDGIDLYVHPSRTEGLPRALIEALSRGCPALGSTAGGIPELLPQWCLFEKGDHRQLSRLFIKTLNDKELLARMASSSYARAAEYTSEVLNARRLSYLQQYAEYVVQRTSGVITL